MISPFSSTNFDRATPGTLLKFSPCPTENHRARQFDQSLVTYSQWLLAFGIRRETERKTKVYKYCCFHVHTFTLYVIPILSFTMLLLTYAEFGYLLLWNDCATPGTLLKFLPCPTENHRARQLQ